MFSDQRDKRLDTLPYELCDIIPRYLYFKVVSFYLPEFKDLLNQTSQPDGIGRHYLGNAFLLFCLASFVISIFSLPGTVLGNYPL